MSWAGRLERERRTLRAMIALFCSGTHAPGGYLCPNCQELLLHAERRLEQCPYGVRKPTCAKCKVHCYHTFPEMRERIREVMRFAGPRMAFTHPVLLLLHCFDSVRCGRGG